MLNYGQHETLDIVVDIFPLVDNYVHAYHKILDATYLFLQGIWFVLSSGYSVDPILC